jgi:hypothetical protein
MVEGETGGADPLEAIDPALLTVSRGLAGIHGFKKKKKKRGPNKWMPFRYKYRYLKWRIFWCSYKKATRSR